MLTVDTITDEQIEDLQLSLDEVDFEDRDETFRKTYRDTVIALCRDPMSTYFPTTERRQRARAHCAEILNARAKELK